jgi:ubiquinone biosynthesis monooxygenase Coq7
MPFLSSLSALPALPALGDWIELADRALHTLAQPARAERPLPMPEGEDTITIGSEASTTPMTDTERRHAAALMRVNHVGEICAQALYSAQAFSTQNPQLRAHLAQAAQEETDHLAWLEARLADLEGRPSYLNPLWYLGALSIGLLAGQLGDRVSLGFVVETERQVEAHLDSHLAALPAQDEASRAVVLQMREDEKNHADQALAAGGMPLPWPVRTAMKLASKIMTTVAYRV